MNINSNLSEREIYIYSFLSYVYQTNNAGPSDFLTPLVELSIYYIQKDFFNAEDIYKEIIKIFDKPILEILIVKELEKLVKRGELDYFDKKIGDRSTYKIKNKKDRKEIDNQYKKSQKEINDFVSDLKKYISLKSSTMRDLSHSKIIKYIKKITERDFVALANFITSKDNSIKFENQEKGVFDLIFEDYINKSVISDTKFKENLFNLINGVILLNLYEFNADIFYQEKTNLGDKVFYLDTNILFRILGFPNIGITESILK